MKTHLTLIALFLLTQTQAQTTNKGTIDPQRPTLTESYSILIPNILQFENGVEYFGEAEEYTWGTFVRGSVHKRVELRAFTDYQHLNSIGGKFIALDAEGSQLGIGASFVYNRVLAENTDDFRVALTKDFGGVFTTYNFGYNGAIYNIGLIGVPIKEQFCYFAEFYNDPTVNRIHTGLTWIPHRDFQFDVNGGWMDTDEWYAGVGASFRLR